jgi:hypothetical protein
MNGARFVMTSSSWAAARSRSPTPRRPRAWPRWPARPTGSTRGCWPSSAAATWSRRSGCRPGRCGRSGNGHGSGCIWSVTRSTAVSGSFVGWAPTTPMCPCSCRPPASPGSWGTRSPPSSATSAASPRPRSWSATAGCARWATSSATSPRRPTRQPPAPRAEGLVTDRAARLPGARPRHRLYALWLLVATTGMRRGELAGLRWAIRRVAAGTTGHPRRSPSTRPVGSWAGGPGRRTARCRRRTGRRRR